MQYARHTAVPTEKSIAKIKRALDRYGANQFAWAEDRQRELASVQFALDGRYIRMVIKLPSHEDFITNKRGRRKPAQIEKAWEQACRQRWRALALAVRAKLDAVESGLSTIEDEFLSWITLPGNTTVGQLVRPQIEQAYLTGDLPFGIVDILPLEEAEEEALDSPPPSRR